MSWIQNKSTLEWLFSAFWQTGLYCCYCYWTIVKSNKELFSFLTITTLLSPSSPAWPNYWQGNICSYSHYLFIITIINIITIITTSIITTTSQQPTLSSSPPLSSLWPSSTPLIIFPLARQHLLLLSLPLLPTWWLWHWQPHIWGRYCLCHTLHTCFCIFRILLQTFRFLYAAVRRNVSFGPSSSMTLRGMVLYPGNPPDFLTSPFPIWYLAFGPSSFMRNTQ